MYEQSTSWYECGWPRAAAAGGRPQAGLEFVEKLLTGSVGCLAGRLERRVLLLPQPLLTFDTKQPRADENGEPLYVVQLIALGEGEAEILAVKVPGMPSGIRQGHPVKVHGLVAQPWTMQDRAGVAFRAARIEPAVPAAKAS
jgi:hypothetical protein